MRAAARRTIRRFLPWWFVGGGVVLLVVSIVLITGHRSLPRQFGALNPVATSSASALTAAPTSSTSQTKQRSSPSSAPPPPTSLISSTGEAGVHRLAPAVSLASASSVASPVGKVSTPRSPPPRASVVPDHLPAGLPERLYLPGAPTSATVHPVVSRDGVLEVPENPADVGWWAGGARPGDPAGTLVIDGHVDSATLGVGALGRLSQLHAGDRITLGTSTGVTMAYRVTALRVFEKASGLPASLFDRGGPARLVLISCGGPFDESAKSYLDNIAVVALPE